MRLHLIHIARLVSPLLFILLTGLLVPEPGYAADFIAGTQSELLDALIFAQDETEYPGVDTITLTDSIQLDLTIYIFSDIVIQGGGNNLTGSNGVFTVDAPGKLQLENLNIINSTNPLENHGTLTVENSTFNNNTGLIKNDGTVSFTDSTFSDNIDMLQNEGSITFTASHIAETSGLNTSGFDNETTGSVSLIDTDIAFSDGEGSIRNDGYLSLTENSTITGSLDNYGIVEIFNTTVNGPDCLYNADSMTIKESTITGCTGYGPFNGSLVNIGTLIVEHSTFIDNHVYTTSDAGSGAGIFNSGTATISDSQFINNTADSVGGAIQNVGELYITNSTFEDNSAFWGSAIANHGLEFQPGHVIVTGSTFKDNSTDQGGTIYNTTSAALINNTFSNNTAVDGSGTDVFNVAGGMDIRYNTFQAAPNATIPLIHNGGSNDIETTAGSLHIANSILLNSNTADACYNEFGTITPVNNLTDDGVCGTLAVTGFDPVLKNNGGNTLTHALLPGSNAINASGACNVATIYNIDQRGMPRDEQCDIGAFEFIENAPTSTYTATLTATNTNVPPTNTATPTQTSILPTATATATETPADNPTATATLEASSTTTSTVDAPTVTATLETTATANPTATATVQPASELLINGDFEAGLDSWSQKNATSDKVKCNKPDKIIAHTGNCAYQFKSGIGENSQLIQSVDLTDKSLPTGTMLDLTGFVSAKGTVNTGIKVVVAFTDDNLAKDKIKLKVNVSTGGYQSVFGALPSLTGIPAVIKVQVWNKGTSGKLFYDALSLKASNGLARLLPLP